ncbi:beta-galactosidase [Sphingomonas mollis]|uniref:Beta-galactosidase n=1 Tax=Sphingomonas mollis TaxID=2795726 RepID=A0ABS0XRL2_9SPHN|nr:beta-galactosidase [Sphingomonas sp. BT553]MBJ6122659.1 beta-galactosidase [Sphingomonas sp. BT553]
MVTKALLCGMMLAIAMPADAAPASIERPGTILYGVAYYDEYTPVDRVDEDARMMRAAGINVVRIAESTWGTLERQPGVFDFTHVDRMLAAMHRQGIKVIVGTPTYAVPTWLARQHPDVLQRPGQYGTRQNMDITDPDYRAACERVIVALIDHVKDHPAVIGYQIDNETRTFPLDTPRIQAAFKAGMQRKWPSLDALNAAWGLNYWSNRINDWDDFPTTTHSINASVTSAFAEFQRTLVTDFLVWQSQLVRGHSRPGQFITHNFDYDFDGGFSSGLQGRANHWRSAKAVDITGVDIYHPSQEKLTGTEIAFFGDLARSIRPGENYFVIETEAQGFPQWTPFPGQLRLQAFSHLASGANMVSYWHWASTANAIETYWRGLLTQDYQPNPVYDEAKTIGADLKRLGSKLVDLKKDNKVAIYVSNNALTAFDAFRINADGRQISYSNVVRGFYDALYRQNIEVDFVSVDAPVPLDKYKLVIVPALYAASDAEIATLNDYAKRGGHLLYSFKSGFSDENVKVRYASQPGAIAEAAGVKYQLFTIPNDVSLADDPFKVGDAENRPRWWMEMLTPTTATVVARYKHPSWPATAAMTRNGWGKGEVSYVGFMPTDAMAEKLLADEVRRAGVEVPAEHWPLIVRRGTARDGRSLRYVLNYSATARPVIDATGGTELLSGRKLAAGEAIDLAPWGVAIVQGR